MAKADFPAHILGILSSLFPGYEWSFVPAEQAGDSPACAAGFVAAIFGGQPSEKTITLRTVPRLSGAVRQRADLLLRGLTPHVILARTNGKHSSNAENENLMFPDLLAPLNRREQEILHWLSEGKRDAEIATILSISARTVQKHVQNLLNKLGVVTRTAAVRSLTVLRPKSPRL